MRSLRAGALPAALVVALALGACGSDDSTEEPAGEAAPAPGDTRAELEHIHGLGVDPGSKALYVATHYGLFRAAEGQTKVERVGTSRQDIMGFSVVGADRFIGSGHPDPSQQLPPNLGLIESRDSGQSWKNVSLLGKADFHVLRSAGRQVYGFNGGTGKLMVSADSGRTWDERTPPAGVFDLAIDPESSQRIVASTQRGIYASPDGGRKWRPLLDDAAGLLAWPSADELFLVDGEGGVSRSANGGRSFQDVGSIGGPPSAFTSHRKALYAALGDGTVVQSTDGAASWAVRATP